MGRLGDIDEILWVLAPIRVVFDSFLFVIAFSNLQEHGTARSLLAPLSFFFNHQCFFNLLDAYLFRGKHSKPERPARDGFLCAVVLYSERNDDVVSEALPFERMEIDFAGYLSFKVSFFVSWVAESAHVTHQGPWRHPQ